MSVTIGHASVDENGKASSGQAGDQTKKEICTRTWYNKPWTSVIRPKNSEDAEKIAKAMEQACANDCIGYDQGQRTTLYAQAKAKKWDLSKITTKCETDCSALVAVCVNAAGISVNKDMYTGNELNVLRNTGRFIVYTSSDYVGKSANLKRGDILLGKGHTAIVLSDGTNVKKVSSSSTTSTNKTTNKTETVKVDAAQSYLKSLAGTYKTTADLNLRQGAGTSKRKICVIPKGKEVKCYGYYTNVGTTKWYLVVYVDGNKKSHTGFASSNYLKK